MGENRNKETDYLKLSKQAKIEPRLLRQKKKMDSKLLGKKDGMTEWATTSWESEKLLTVNMASGKLILNLSFSIYKSFNMFLQGLNEKP